MPSAYTIISKAKGCLMHLCLSALVTYCYITNAHTFSGLNNIYFYVLSLIWGLGIWTHLTEFLASGSLTRLRSRSHYLKVHLIWRFYWEGVTSKITYAVVSTIQFLWGCWTKRISSSPAVGQWVFSAFWHKDLCNVALCFLKASKEEVGCKTS